MFTGIVVEQAVVEAPAPSLVLASSVVSADVAVGDSVAVDGCCLTVTTIDGERLHFDAVPETLARTTLGDRVVGDLVNLEPALRAGDRMGGHWVQGHVDGVGEVASLTPHSNAVDIWVKAPEARGSLCDRERIDHRQRRQPDRHRIRPRRFRRVADPAHA